MVSRQTVGRPRAYAALDLAKRVTAARRWARVFWLTGGVSRMRLELLLCASCVPDQ